MNATLINKAVLMSFNTVNTDSFSLLGEKKTACLKTPIRKLRPKAQSNPQAALGTTRQTVPEDRRP